ncbi:hypothetical protein ABK040_005670 [Willaertia magna]
MSIRAINFVNKFINKTYTPIYKKSSIMLMGLSNQVRYHSTMNNHQQQLQSTDLSNFQTMSTSSDIDLKAAKLFGLAVNNLKKLKEEKQRLLDIKKRTDFHLKEFHQPKSM